MGRTCRKQGGSVFRRDVCVALCVQLSYSHFDACVECSFCGFGLERDTVHACRKWLLLVVYGHDHVGTKSLDRVRSFCDGRRPTCKAKPAIKREPARLEATSSSHRPPLEMSCVRTRR